MRFFLLFFGVLLASSSVNAATCSPVGTTKMADDGVTIVACLKTSATDPTPVWKPMAGGLPSKLNIVKITSTLCKWKGVYTIVASCPDDYELLGCGGGEGDLQENAESWFLDPDFVARKCVGYIRQPACNGVDDQAVVIASCYKP
ncbi:MAG: hypothetical protein PHD48_01710 [Alphaproteobacteria bacterium]|nr:hypothetical protein [Alphaproteobacteria bacterium]